MRISSMILSRYLHELWLVAPAGPIGIDACRPFSGDPRRVEAKLPLGKHGFFAADFPVNFDGG